jgi:hypothetical protein
MRGIQQRVESRVQQRVTKGVWEVIITDPSLNKFTFGPSLISHYLMVDIISPYGQNSVKYNTIQSNSNVQICIPLNFEDIDDCNISEIKVSSPSIFFKKWKLDIVDKRDGSVHPLNHNDSFTVEPVIIYNKLFGIGFMPMDKSLRPPFFELQIKRR